MHLCKLLQAKDIWVFSDSQAAIQRIQKSDVNADQSHVLAIEN